MGHVQWICHETWQSPSLKSKKLIMTENLQSVETVNLGNNRKHVFLKSINAAHGWIFSISPCIYYSDHCFSAAQKAEHTLCPWPGHLSDNSEATHVTDESAHKSPTGRFDDILGTTNIPWVYFRHRDSFYWFSLGLTAAKRFSDVSFAELYDDLARTKTGQQLLRNCELNMCFLRTQ